MFQRLLNRFLGIRPRNVVDNETLEQKKREFFSDYPKNPVTLPCDGSGMPALDESPSTQENVIINETIF